MVAKGGPKGDRQGWRASATDKGVRFRLPATNSAQSTVRSITFGMMKMVARGGIEPPTRGFSIHCSTD